MEVELKKEDRELLKSVIEGLKNPVQTSTTQNSSETSTTKAEKTEETHEIGSKPFECKNCNDLLKKQLLNVSNLVECDKEKGGCGAIVPKDGEKCPFCGNTEAKAIQ